MRNMRGDEMRFLRWFLCYTNLKHRLVQKWMPLNKAGLDPMSAALFGCQTRTINGGKHVEYFECRHCLQKMAGFEVHDRGWSFEVAE